MSARPTWVFQLELAPRIAPSMLRLEIIGGQPVPRAGQVTRPGRPVTHGGGEHLVAVGVGIGADDHFLAHRPLDRETAAIHLRLDVLAERQLEASKILEHRGQARAPGRQIEVAQVHAVNLDCARLRVIQPAQQLCQGRFAGAVLPNDGE